MPDPKLYNRSGFKT